MPQPRSVYDISGGKCPSALLASRRTASREPIYLTASLAPKEQNIYLTGSIGTAKGARSIGMVSEDDLIAAANQLVTVAQAGGLTVRVGAGAVEALLADVQRCWSSSVESSKRECRIHRSAECTLAEG